MPLLKSKASGALIAAETAASGAEESGRAFRSGTYGRAEGERHEPGALIAAETAASGAEESGRAFRSGTYGRAEGERHEPGALING